MTCSTEVGCCALQYIMPDPDVPKDMAGKDMRQVDGSYCDGMVARPCTQSSYHDIGNNLLPGQGNWPIPVELADWDQNEEAKVNS